MRNRLVWLAGGLGLAAAIAYRGLRQPIRPPEEPDPRAEQLRTRIEESRELVDERDEFEAAETPLDRADPGGLDERRKHVHERGRAAVERMRRAAPEQPD